MTEFLTTNKSRFNVGWSNTGFSVVYSGTDGNDGDSEITTTVAGDTRTNRTIDTGAPIANKTFTFSVELYVDVAETLNGARLWISNTDFSDLEINTVAMTNGYVKYSVTTTFGSAAVGNLVYVRLDYPEPNPATSPHTFFARNASLVDVVTTPSITNVDTDGEITDGQGTATLTVADFGGDITSITADDGTYTSSELLAGGTGTSYTWNVTDITALTEDTASGQPNWFTGSLELTASRTGESASSSFVWNPAAGWAVRTVTGNVSESGSISENRGAGAYSDGSVAYYDSTLMNVTVAGVYQVNDPADLPLNFMVWDIDTGTIEVVTIVDEPEQPASSRKKLVYYRGSDGKLIYYYKRKSV